MRLFACVDPDVTRNRILLFRRRWHASARLNVDLGGEPGPFYLATLSEDEANNIGIRMELGEIQRIDLSRGPKR